MYSLTCFGHPSTHHQELNNCSSSLWFYRWSVEVAVLLSQPARPRTQHNCHHDTKVKPEASTAVIEFLMMGGKTPETCRAVNKCQDYKLENCCTWLVIYLNCITTNRWSHCTTTNRWSHYITTNRWSHCITTNRWSVSLKTGVNKFKCYVP
jgi:hypothetical protein